MVFPFVLSLSKDSETVLTGFDKLKNFSIFSFKVHYLAKKQYICEINFNISKK